VTTVPLISDGASTLTHLEGALSGATYPADRLARLDPVDGRPLLARYDLERAGATLTPEHLAERRRGGMWRWAELLPVRNAVNVVHLGEGATPLLPMPALGRALGLDRLLVKAEGLNPTGAFKARGMAAAVSRARELGARSFIAPSAGNAAGALAAYGAAAGLPAPVLMPADVPAANRDEVLVCGAQVLLVDGLISDCGRLSQLIAEETGAFDVSTLKEPYRVEGKKTMGLELAEDLALLDPVQRFPWVLPDVVVYPTGGGTGLVGMWKAFAELEALGLVGARRPRMIAVQTEGCAPIVRAFAEGERFAEPWQGAATRASGIRVPGAVGDFLVLDAVRASGGTAIAVPEDEVDAHQRLAGRLGAGYVAPETAAVLAGIRHLVDTDAIAPDETVVAFDTGIGHKYPPPPGLPTPPVVPADEADVERLVALAAAGGP
jgi:threonine synthase